MTKATRQPTDTARIWLNGETFELCKLRLLCRDQGGVGYDICTCDGRVFHRRNGNRTAYPAQKRESAENRRRAEQRIRLGWCRYEAIACWQKHIAEHHRFMTKA